MVLVRGNDQYVGVEIAGETTWGTDPLGGYVRVYPLLNESIAIERQPFPRSKELGGGVGALSAYDSGRQVVRGSFTVYPVYNSAWFAKLLSHAHGGTENVRAGKLPNGGTPGASFTNAMTHFWAPQSFRSGALAANPTLPIWGSTSGVAPGLSIRVWKAGPSLGGTENEKATRTVEVFSGCLITGWTWEQPEDDRPQVTFNFIGRSVAEMGLGTNAGMLKIKHLPVFPTTATNGSPAWTNPNNMLASDGSVATSSATAASLVLSGFPLTSYPASAGTITGIQAIVECACTGTSPAFTLELSWDGGTSWTSTKSFNPGMTQTTMYVGGSEDLWGRAGWTQGETGLSNFRVRVKAAGTGTAWSVDSVRIQVFNSCSGLLPADTGQVVIGMRDFYNKSANAYVGGLCSFGAVAGSGYSAFHLLIPFNVRGFRLNYDGHLEVPPSFLTAIDTVEKAGHTEAWELTGSVTSMLEQNFAQQYSPKWMYSPGLNTQKWDGCLRLRYASQGDAGGTGGEAVPYVLDMYVPRLVIQTCKDNVEGEGVVPVEWTFQGTLGEVLKDESGAALGTTEYLPVPWLVSTLDTASGAYGL